MCSGQVSDVVGSEEITGHEPCRGLAAPHAPGDGLLSTYRILHKLGRPTNGLLSEADLALVDDISWTAL